MGKIAIGVIVITFTCYAIVKFTPIGIEILSIEGYLLASVIVSAVGIFMAYLEMKGSHKNMPPSDGNGIVS